MGSYRNIDDFINAIVLSFGINDLTESFVSKINSFKDSNIIISGNRAVLKQRNFSLSIMVDKENKKIEMETIGAKKIDNGHRQFINKETYVKSNNSIVKKSTKDQYDEVLAKDSTKIKKFSDIKYSFYDEDRFLGKSHEKQFNVLTYKNGSLVRDYNDKYENVIYMLLNGDKLMVTSSNGDSKYYYCMKNRNDGKEIVQEIGEKKFDEIFNLNETPERLVNNDYIYNLKSSSLNNGAKTI